MIKALIIAALSWVNLFQGFELDGRTGHWIGNDLAIGEVFFFRPSIPLDDVPEIELGLEYLTKHRLPPNNTPKSNVALGFQSLVDNFFFFGSCPKA